MNACLTNIAKLTDIIKAKDDQHKRLNMLVREGYDGKVKPKPKVKYDYGRHKIIMDGLGHKRGEKINGKHVINGWESPKFTKGTNLSDLMNVAHGVSKSDFSKVKEKAKDEKKSKGKEKVKEVAHEPFPSYTNGYMVTMDH